VTGILKGVILHLEHPFPSFWLYNQGVIVTRVTLTSNNNVSIEINLRFEFMFDTERMY
jgi:hypothetical protein